jgi:tetratricopeptide (TPR) repeat protein
MFVKGYIAMSSFARWASAGSGCLLVSGLFGCVAVKSPAPFTPKSNSMLSIGEDPQRPAKPQPLTLEQLVISQTTAETLGELYARGLARLERRDFVLAEGDFALCVKVQPEGPLAAFCLYYDGIANDELRRFDVALQRFVEINNRFPEHALALQASLRALRLAVHLERWSLAVPFSERVIGKRKRLKPFELVLPYGALAMDAVSRGDDNQAEQHVARARSIIEEVGLDVPGRIHRDLAVVSFALGELRRIRAARLNFVPMPVKFAEVLEERCQLILDAQSAYSDAMRAYDAHWSTMAGYRVGELYASLHADVMSMVTLRPIETVERRQLFEGAMRLRYAVLIQKARHMLSHTLELAERTGEQSSWVERAKATLADLAKQSQAEEEAIQRLPYSREALTYALSRLANGDTKNKPEPRPQTPVAMPKKK